MTHHCIAINIGFRILKKFDEIVRIAFFLVFSIICCETTKKVIPLESQQRVEMIAVRH